MIADDIIPLSPLDEGDAFAIEVVAGEPDGQDEVKVRVPAGKGTVYAAWLDRQMTETPELRQQRRAADDLAVVMAQGAPPSKKQASQEGRDAA